MWYAKLVAWGLVGLLAGSLAALFVTWRSRGYGLWHNLLLGMAGALVGGFTFHFFAIWPQLEQITFSARDIVAAILGSIVVIAVRFVSSGGSGAQ